MPAKVVNAKTNVEESDGMKVDNIKPQVVRFVIPDVHRVFVLAPMLTAEFGRATGILPSWYRVLHKPGAAA